MDKKKKSLDWLLENIGKVNIMDRIDEDTQAKIASRCVLGFNRDEESLSDWTEKTEAGMKVAKQITEEKTFPWAGAANIKYPLMATAAIQFAARAYPQIVDGRNVVKATVVGEDPTGAKEERADRISKHMSYQILDQMVEWEAGMDQLLHGLPIVGTYFKKTFFDTLLQRNASQVIFPFDLVINNKHKGTIDTCRRITHKIQLYKNEVIERENADIFVSGASSHMKSQCDEDNEQELFLEQHCWYDLDGDGYEEPYIFTVHFDSGKLVRAVANYDIDTLDLRGDKIIKISPIQYFTKFSFIPSPDGEFYDIGFAQLLGPINEAMSTIINQLLDSGALSNLNCGFISKGLRWQGGKLEFELGEWKPVDTTGISLKDAILPLPVREPSGVLFQLLGMLDEAGQKLASVSDAMAGETPSQNTPATSTLATIEQGLKVFTAIYKRVFRALQSEYKKLYRLNSQYLEDEEYFRVLDTKQAIRRKDYGLEDMDITPAADPNMSSEAQKLARANALFQTMPVNPDPVAQMEILRQYYEAIGAKNIEMLANVQAAQQRAQRPPPPNPELLKIQLETQKAADKMQIELGKLGLDHAENIAKIQKLEAEIHLLKAQTMKTVAEAEAVEPGQQMQVYKQMSDEIKNQQQHDRELKKIEIAKEKGVNDAGNNTKGTVKGLGEQSNNSPSPQAPPPAIPPPPGVAGGGANPQLPVGGINGAPNVPPPGQNPGSGPVVGGSEGAEGIEEETE